MVAAQAFFDAASSRSVDAKLRRAQLRVLSPALEGLSTLPEHLQRVVVGIFHEIEDRVFRPIQNAPTLDEAMLRAQALFESFAILWQAVIRALGPWLQENPDRIDTLGHGVADAWTSDETHHLGDEARAWFAAAQDARAALADAIMREPAVPPENEDRIGRGCLVADFALQFGLFLAHQDRPSTATELPLAMGKLAYDAVKDAYVLATTPRFEDPVHGGS